MRNGYGTGPHPVRKRSLERQTTLYDDEAYDEDDEPLELADSQTYYDAVQDVADDQTRQWDMGGRGTSMTKILPRIPIKHSGSCNDDLIYQESGGVHHKPYVGSFGGGAVQLPATPMSAALLAASTPVGGGGGAKKQRLLPQPLKPNPVPIHPRLLPNMPSPTAIVQPNDTDFIEQVTSCFSAFKSNSSSIHFFCVCLEFNLLGQLSVSGEFRHQ